MIQGVHIYPGLRVSFNPIKYPPSLDHGKPRGKTTRCRVKTPERRSLLHRAFVQPSRGVGLQQALLTWIFHEQKTNEYMRHLQLSVRKAMLHLECYE